MRDALDEQIATFHGLLPELKQKYGPAWVLLVDHKPIDAFKNFDKAALYAAEHFGGKQVLIRHTGESRETVPFIFVERAT